MAHRGSVTCTPPRSWPTPAASSASRASASGGAAGIGPSARQLIALLAGAVVSGMVLHTLRSAAPAVPLLLLAAAAVMHLRAKHRRNDPVPERQAARP